MLQIIILKNIIYPYIHISVAFSIADRTPQLER